AAMVEQSTAASHALRRETSELAALISRFRVGTEPAAPSRAKPRAAVQLRSVAGGNAARKPAPVAGQDGWEEF
ncbi:MAG: hypothetical protein WA840_08955, partial [Caulobacteraceae bacterium]